MFLGGGRNHTEAKAKKTSSQIRLMNMLCTFPVFSLIAAEQTGDKTWVFKKKWALHNRFPRSRFDCDELV